MECKNGCWDYSHMSAQVPYSVHQWQQLHSSTACHASCIQKTAKIPLDFAEWPCSNSSHSSIENDSHMHPEPYLSTCSRLCMQDIEGICVNMPEEQCSGELDLGLPQAEFGAHLPVHDPPPPSVTTLKAGGFPLNSYRKRRLQCPQDA